MKLKNIVLLVIVMIVFQAKGQQNKMNLSIGDNLPVFIIPKIINTVKGSGNTADYKNKLLIVDFWSTGCSGCVEALPKMEILQKRFKDKVVILPVTSENITYTHAFLKNNKYTMGLKIQSVVEDQLFSNYFKFQYLPHEVWVYRGKVIAITDQQYVDEHNIQDVLDGKQINWPIKYDFSIFESKKPLFGLDERQIDANSTSISYTAISDYREKYSSALLTGASGIVRDSIKKTVRSYFLNESILSAYVLNWMKLVNQDNQIKPSFLMQPNQIVWEVADKSKYTYEKKLGYLQEWLRKNAICFESVSLDTGQNDHQIHQLIISELNRLLGLHVRWEKRKEKVFAVIKNTAKFYNYLENNQSTKQKYLISSLVDNLNQESNSPYIFDESGDRTTRIPLSNANWKNFYGIKKILNNYGFDLKEEERVVDKLVFTEIEGGKLIDAQLQEQAKKRREIQKDVKEPLFLENQNFLINNSKKSGVKQTSSGLQYKILHEGLGAKPTITDKVQINYEGSLVNGKIFDSSYEEGRPATFSVNQVINGWSEALQMMSVGSKWIIYIPATLAYGSHTNNGRLPSNSTLIFEIELIKILP